MLLFIAHQEGHTVSDQGVAIATIDGENTLVFTVQYEGATIYTDGTNWWIGL